MEQTTYFNSRPSARGDKANVQPLLLGNKFQFTPLREGRLSVEREGRKSQRISIHAPPPRLRQHKFQFTPLREGRLLRSGVQNDAMYISIHAPPRGATVFSDMLELLPNISIHAPPRGATKHNGKDYASDVISIHAPPRGATLSVLVIVI